MTENLRRIDSFGEVAAEDDKILLRYFLSTDTVQKIENGAAFLVLGRKGAGKTALVRHFTEGGGEQPAIALSLRSYPWGVHASRIDRGADPADAYVASWRYLVAIEVASWALERSGMKCSEVQKSLRNFFKENYGDARPKLTDILRPRRLSVKGFSFAPEIFGNKLGSVDLDRTAGDVNFGIELEALTNAIMKNTASLIRECGCGAPYLHFDELDAGMDRLDESRKSILVGLILALRSIKRQYQDLSIDVRPVLYLRTDIWDDLSFSDKNKITQTNTLQIEWNMDSLRSLIEERLKEKFGRRVSWQDIIDEQLMRGSQNKWSHIVARTLNRPRDVIQFLNVALRTAKRRNDPSIVLLNEDIVNSRTDYSAYFKREFDDEILPHWPQWEEALHSLS